MRSIRRRGRPCWRPPAGPTMTATAPARIFMGDSGSQYLGYVFAAEGVICPIKSYTALALFIPLLALGLPIFETFFSFFRRTLNNKRFYHADKRHLFHFLLEKGLSQKLTIWIFYIISIILTMITWAILVRENKLVFSFLLSFLGILILILAFYLFRSISVVCPLCRRLG